MNIFKNFAKITPMKSTLKVALVLSSLFVVSVYASEVSKEFNYELFLELIIFILLLGIFILSKFFYKEKEKIRLDSEAKVEEQKSKEKEKLLSERNKFVSMREMIENIAHQWRQPLSQINSAVLIVDDLLFEKGIKSIDIEEKLLEIESQTEYMSKTIDDFKNFFEPNKEKKSFMMHELLQKSIYILKGNLKYNNITVETNLNNTLKCFGHPSELQQVIVAILNNAKDALLQNKVKNAKITINSKRYNGMIIITICDNAGGINESIIDKIFDPYFTTKHKSQGTGLGLYISKLIVEESLNGELTATNTEVGACFEILQRLLDE